MYVHLDSLIITHIQSHGFEYPDCTTTIQLFYRQSDRLFVLQKIRIRAYGKVLPVEYLRGTTYGIGMFTVFNIDIIDIKLVFFILLIPIQMVWLNRLHVFLYQVDGIHTYRKRIGSKSVR